MNCSSTKKCEFQVGKREEEIIKRREKRNNKEFLEKIQKKKRGVPKKGIGEELCNTFCVPINLYIRLQKNFKRTLLTQRT